MDDLLKAIDSEKNNRFKKSWSKLEKGNKLNRLNLFIEDEIKKNDLDEDQSNKLKKLLNNLFFKSIFSKSTEIEYCEETTKILTIKNLKYDEEKKEYIFNLPKKTIKPINKSKSKIDRHFSRSKENK